MCTAVNFTVKDHYFGRNLDLDVSYHEEVAVTPRRYPFAFRRMPALPQHFAMIGMATVVDGHPLYYEATNERGVSMAGLNFPGNAHYNPEAPGRDNITPFEFIPWVLGQCATMDDVRDCLSRINLLDEPFSAALALAPLHWMISWKDASIVVESMQDGLHIHENPLGVMTNNPPFPMQLRGLANYMALSPRQPENAFGPDVPLATDCSGMGALGLPGDLSSTSRFVRVAYMKHFSRCGETEAECVNQFFHILGSVRVPRGSVLLDHDACEITVYSSCCNTDRGIYYYVTHENSRITGVDMHRENLDAETVVRYPLTLGPQILMAN